MENDLITKQLALCAKYGVIPFPAPNHLKVGINLNVKEGLQPVNGLRIKPTEDTTGWYIWAGEEWSNDPNFFVPLHVEHIESWCPQILHFLQLPPGWRFLIAPNVEDAWFDKELLETP